jgi:putative selenate reductase
MSDRMRPVPFRELTLRCLAELRQKGSIFDIPQEHFWKPAGRNAAGIFSSTAVNPVGPAAGPHTQLTQNIIASWLSGGRYIELKTVQKLDSLTVEKPCIDAADEGYNVEWSTELSLDQAYDEYLKAWIMVHVLHALTSDGRAPVGSAGTLFNMSVGYDLAGIKTEKMDRLIGRLIDSSHEPLFDRYVHELAVLAADHSFLSRTPWAAKAALLRELPALIPSRLCASVTLSTMHGCPPGEIESICAYMIQEKKLDTLVKLNPTLLGYERVRDTLSGLGYDYIALKPEGFAKDLQYEAAVPMLTRLLALGREKGRHFGAKLSNTLAAANTKGVLPGDEMYMSGRALYPLTVSLAARLAADFKGKLPLSFSGGVSAWNIGEILDAGIRPITVATEVLKPGGYARLRELAEASERHAAGWNAKRVDAARLQGAAQAALASAQSKKSFRGTDKVAVSGPLPLFDCFVAPCKRACAIHQDVPEYVHLVGEGRYREAFDVLYRRNPLPFMLGYLCDHKCMGNCTRKDWEGSVRIRDMKRIAAERGYAEFRKSGALAAHKAPARGIKAAVIGAGPAGLSAAQFLAREGFEVHLFEREKEPGGIVRYLLPGFRIPAAAVAKDASLLQDLGVQMHFGYTDALRVEDLKANGYRYVLLGVGADADRGIGIQGAREALDFLREFRRNPSAPRLGRTVAVVGAGDTAMDAARAARRCKGVKEVRIVYRRTGREMPASDEERASAQAEGIAFHFLRAPESWKPETGLVCRVMDLGPADASGRAAPVATSRTETVPADTLITAVGAAVDDASLERLGLAGDMAKVDGATLETGIEGVFLIGDAAEGAATIVRAAASARKAVEAIVKREGGSTAPAWGKPPEDPVKLRGLRDGLVPVSAAAAKDARVATTEGVRCLGCQALCIKCVEVCPNRANTFVRVTDGFRDVAQIVHIDAFCNECGNCATFCPWEGRPYRDKLTVFATEEDFRDSTNQGFFLANGKGSLRSQGNVTALALDRTGAVAAEGADTATLAVISVIVREHGYMLGGTP